MPHTSFSLRDQLDTHQAVDIPTISREGFLLTGFFPRVLGKCVSWSQSTHGAPEQRPRATQLSALAATEFC